VVNFKFAPLKFTTGWRSVLIQKRREDVLKYEPTANTVLKCLFGITLYLSELMLKEIINTIKCFALLLLKFFTEAVLKYEPKASKNKCRISTMI
jgi:hypothetical protein